MADLERAAEAGDGGRGDAGAERGDGGHGRRGDGDVKEDTHRSLKRHYDDMAARHEYLTFRERRAFRSVHVRHMNNFVKACFADAVARVVLPADKPALDVADVAGGRGQDHSKWMYAARNADGKRVGRYYGMDLSEKDTALAYSMAARYFPKADARFVCGDMTAGFEGLDDASVDVVSCQLALHYVCDDPARVHAVFSEAYRVLRPTGAMLVSFTDGRAIVRRARDAAATCAEDGVVVVTNAYCTYRIGSEHLRKCLPSPWGHPYVFRMEDSVEDVAEFLCHEGAVMQQATRAGFVLGMSQAFDEAARQLVLNPRYAEIGRLMDGTGIEDPQALDTAQLYRMCVLAKDAAVLHRVSKQLYITHNKR